MDVFSEEYLKWMERETREGRGVFCVSGAQTDEYNQSLPELFNRIDNYVRTNYYFDVEDYGRAYNFTDGSNLYTIYTIFGPEVGYLLRRTPDKSSYIHLDDVRSNVVRGRQNLEVLQRMKEISHQIHELADMGAPMDLVEAETTSQIRLLKQQKRKPFEQLDK